MRGFDILGTTTFVIGLTGLVLGVSRGGLDGWNDPIVITGLVLAAVLLPLWVLIESRVRAPMLDLAIFRNRLFAAASAAAFINGLARFALMFLFVFYFQGAQGDDPITAGIKLIPLALGMLVASPLAGNYADRHGSRTLAALGMVVSGVGLALMTTLQVRTPYWQSALWLLLVGVGSGMFNSPNTAAMMGTVPAKRRGIAAGARTLLQNTGAVLSIAFVLAIVTSAVPKATLFASSPASRRACPTPSSPPSSATCTSPSGCSPPPRSSVPLVCLMRPRTSSETSRPTRRRSPRADRGRRAPPHRGRPQPAMTGGALTLRIGDVARMVGTTARTIRYYEEIGLLPEAPARPSGRTASTASTMSSACAR